MRAAARLSQRAPRVGGRAIGPHLAHAAVAVAVAVAGIGTRAAWAGPAADSIRYTVTITDINRVGLTVTNYAFFGNNFNSRAPSFEFPLGSGFEHMSRAGLWVGARAISDTALFTGVSTAIIDNAQGSNSTVETEFTPMGTTIEERSRILNSRYYSPLAISDQDFECLYGDRPGRGPSGFRRERHTPLNIIVRQRTLGFSLRAADAFVVARFDIINDGPPLQDLWVGLYAQLVSGDKNAYGIWPPSGSPGSWYYSTYVAYDSPRRMYKEHYCQQAPYPDACNFPYTPPWAAVKLLSVRPDSVADKTISLNWWPWSLGGDASRDEDVELYALMSSGVLHDPHDCIPGTDCSPVMVLSVGPWAQVLPGDTVSVDFAFVGGDDEASLEANSDFAQFASDIGYQLPSPPPSPRLLVETDSNRVDLYWDDSPESVEDPTSPAPDHRDFEGYRVYLGLDRQNPTRVAQFDRAEPPHDTTGFNTGLAAARLDAPKVVDGVPYRYHYRVTGLRDGFSYWGAVTSYDIGDTKVTSLESGIGQNKFQAVTMPRPGDPGRRVIVFPNPYRVEAAWDRGARVRDHYLWFAQLPSRCVLRVYTLGGDRVFETHFDGSSYRGAGARGLHDPKQDLDTPPPVLPGASYAWNLITDRGQALASGLYLFAVEDLDSGAVSRGKFVVVKSDREE